MNIDLLNGPAPTNREEILTLLHAALSAKWGAACADTEIGALRTASDKELLGNLRTYLPVGPLAAKIRTGARMSRAERIEEIRSAGGLPAHY